MFLPVSLTSLTCMQSWRVPGPAEWSRWSRRLSSWTPWRACPAQRWGGWSQRVPLSLAGFAWQSRLWWCSLHQYIVWLPWTSKCCFALRSELLLCNVMRVKVRGRLGVHNDEGVQGLPVAGQRLLGGRHLSQGSLVVTGVQWKILSSMETFYNMAKCLLDAVENPLSLLRCHTLCLIRLHHVAKLELSRLF